MSNKLVDLSALSEYKTQSDAKYQDKLTAGAGITISSNTISASGSPTYSGNILTGSKSVPTLTITKMGEVTLQPGIYFVQYSCQFASNNTGVRQSGFSTTTNDLSGFGMAWRDSQLAVNGTLTQTMISGVFEVSANDYPNGRTFYFLANQTSGSSLTAYPRAYYLKF